MYGLGYDDKFAGLAQSKGANPEMKCDNCGLIALRDAFELNDYACYDCGCREISQLSSMISDVLWNYEVRDER